MLQNFCLISSGDHIVSTFESDFASYVSQSHAIAVNSGTSGLHAALLACGIGPGDEVIVPAIAVIMDAYVVLQCGATPVFCDVCENTFNIDVNKAASLITPRTKAVIAIEWEGLPCDTETLRSLIPPHVRIISDCARSLRSTTHNLPSVRFSDISVYSFESKKHLTCGGEGGMVVTNNSQLAQLTRQYAGLGYRHLTADATKTHLASKLTRIQITTVFIN